MATQMHTATIGAPPRPNSEPAQDEEAPRTVSGYVSSESDQLVSGFMSSESDQLQSDGDSSALGDLDDGNRCI